LGIRTESHLGIETDFDGAAVKGSTTINGPFNNFAGALQTGATLGQFTASEKLNWLGTLRGRFGMVVANRALIYATGGLAYGSFDLATNFAAPAFNFPATGNVTHAGYTLGGGVEWAYDARWSTKLEGLYYNLGTTTLLAGDTTGNFPTFIRGKDFELQGGIIRLGLNYKFGD
jgi:outer membrane immunogenic protein